MVRRLATCVCFMFLVSATANAQRGRGMAGPVGGAVGRPGPAARPMPAPVGAVRGPVVAARPFVGAAPAFNRPIIAGPGFGRGFAHPGVVGRGLVNPGVGFGFVRQPRVLFTQPYLGFYDPFWTAPIYTQPAYVAPVQVGPSYVEPSVSQAEVDLAYEVQRLSREVEQLRLEQSAAAPRQLAPPPPERPAVPVVLVFRDGRRQSIMNYAIVGQTLWVLDELNSVRIPLSDLDLDATQRANPGQGLRLVTPAR